jgi:hypothetical protein
MAEVTQLQAGTHAASLSAQKRLMTAEDTLQLRHRYARTVRFLPDRSSHFSQLPHTQQKRVNITVMTGAYGFNKDFLENQPKSVFLLAG